jgi:hypothetical protein
MSDRTERVAKLRTFKRELTALLKTSEMEQLTGMRNSILADYLTMQLMSVTRLMDNIYEYENK